MNLAKSAIGECVQRRFGETLLMRTQPVSRIKKPKMQLLSEFSVVAQATPIPAADMSDQLSISRCRPRSHSRNAEAVRRR